MAEKITELDPLHNIVAVSWHDDIVGVFCVIESNHFLTNFARLTWHRPIGGGTDDTPYVGPPPAMPAGYPNTTGAPPVVFPHNKAMQDFYFFWLASVVDFPTGFGDDSSIDSFIINLNKFEIPIIEMQLSYVTPSLVTRGAAVDGFSFNHGNFKRKIDDAAGPVVQEADGADGPVFQTHKDLNDLPLSKSVEITIIKTTKQILLIGQP